jgi:ubiquinone/menaquinone biosynthesis C-methylase UbiE
MPSGPCDYDAELRRHDQALRRAYGVQPGQHVLDIGCGTGQTTRDAARKAEPGSAFGVDIRAAAIERARDLAREQGVRNAAFERADVQLYEFAPDSFDLAISRFGTMFFADPVAAFANIALALRPGARLVMAVWQAPERNEWEAAIQQALAAPDGRTAGQEAFSLADPVATRKILDAAGFAEVAVDDLSEPVYYGPDVATALAWVRGFSSVSDTLGQLGPAARDRALGRLRDVLAAHLTDSGVWFGSRAWIVSCGKPPAQTADPRASQY